MAAKRAGRRRNKTTRTKKVPQKVSTGRRKVATFKKHTANKLSLGSIEEAGDAAIAAARRLWLSAESLVGSQVSSLRRSAHKARSKLSR
jgi:hypothetical protein